MVEKGMESIEVANFYDENCNDVTIELNKNLTPSENAQKYFKKYNKMKHAKVEISHQISLNKEEIDYLENIILSIENCENLAELQDIKEELAKVGYIKTQKKNSKRILSHLQNLMNLCLLMDLKYWLVKTISKMTILH